MYLVIWAEVKHVVTVSTYISRGRGWHPGINTFIVSLPSINLYIFVLSRLILFYPLWLMDRRPWNQLFSTLNIFVYWCKFRLSKWTYIEYRIKISMVTYTFFAFLDSLICIPFFLKEQQLSNIFILFVRCTPSINIFGSKSRTQRQQNS